MATSNIHYTARTGTANISTANSNLNGTGAISNVITGQLDGTIVTSVTVKATGNTSEGMVRLYLKPSGGTSSLIQELYIPANVQTSVIPAYGVTVNINFTIKSGDSITASTENSDSFNVIADGLDFKSCDCAA